MQSHDTEAVIQKIKDYFEERDFNYTFNEKNKIFSFSIGIKRYTLFPKEYCITIYEAFPLQNKKKADKIQEFINRANYGLTLGNFEYDIRDGEIRYKICILLTSNLEVIFEDDLIFSSISVANAMCERYYRGFANVIFKGMSAKQAVSMCEE